MPQPENRLAGWADRPGMDPPPSIWLDLLLVDEAQDVQALAAAGRCCPCESIDAAFYRYLDEGALAEPLYDALLAAFHQPTPTGECYTFACHGEGCIPRRFGPGTVPRAARALLVVAENSRRGIRTELPAHCGSWRSMAALLGWPVLAVLPVAEAVRLWFEPGEDDPAPPKADFVKATYQGCTRCLYGDTLADELWMRDFEPEEEPERLLAAIPTAMAGRRLGFAGRVHPAEAPDGADWKIINRLHTPLWTGGFPAGKDYPALCTVLRTGNGRWQLREHYDAGEKPYGDILTELIKAMDRRRGTLWALAVETPAPLGMPEQALRSHCYCFLLDGRARTIELTEDADALQAFRPAVAGVCRYRSR